MSFQRDGKMSNMTWAAYLGKIDQVNTVIVKYSQMKDIKRQMIKNNNNVSFFGR